MECDPKIDETRRDSKLNWEGGDVENVKIQIDGLKLDFHLAEGISRLIAERKGSEMLIAWYDPVRDIHYPNVDCCGDDEPAWYIYGKNRGGKLMVDVEGYKFFFV